MLTGAEAPEKISRKNRGRPDPSVEKLDRDGGPKLDEGDTGFVVHPVPVDKCNEVVTSVVSDSEGTKPGAGQ